MGALAAGHRRIDLRSIELHRAIAAKLQADSSLLNLAWDNLERQSHMTRALVYATAWRQLLIRPLSELADLLVEDSEHMTAMRQSSPFAGVLTPKERLAIYDRFVPGRNGDV
jgi:hypothetical protein